MTHIPIRLVVLVAIHLTAVASCGDDDTTPPATRDAGADGDGGDSGTSDGDAPDGAAPAGIVLRFTVPASGLPAPLEVPWPSDAYRTDPDGTIVDGLTDWSRAHVGRSEAPFEAFGTLDGFGLQTGALFPVDGGELDVSSLPSSPAACAAEGSSVALLDIDPAAASPGARLACTAMLAVGTPMLVIAPYEPLDAGHTYAVVVTSGVTAAGGDALTVAPAFAAIRDDEPDARDGALGSFYGEAIDRVVAQSGIARGDIVALTVFTTQTTHRRLRVIRDALVAGDYGPPPALVTDGPRAPYRVARFGASAHAGWTATLDEWMGTPARDADGNDLPGLPAPPELPTTGIGHDAIGAVLNATYGSPGFLRPYAVGSDPASGTIAYDDDGQALVHDEDAEVPITIALPSAPAPADGYPVVIYMHGGGHDRSIAFAVANELARHGIATLAIDAPYHGSRVQPDARSNGPGTFVGPDGLGDDWSPETFLTMLGHFQNHLAMRDAFWQATLDLVQLRRLVAVADLTPVAEQYGGIAPRLDATQVGYVGMSMGGFLGSTLAAVEPRESIGPFVLDVPIAGLLLALAESPGIMQQWPLLASVGGVSRDAASSIAEPWLHLAQSFFDASDPGVFAAEIGRRAGAGGHDVWLLAAREDDASPRRGTDILARALGAVQVAPTVRPVAGLAEEASPLGPDPEIGRVVGYFEVSPGNHGHLLWRYQDHATVLPWPRDEEPRFERVSATAVRQPVVGAQRAMIHFFETSWAGAAEIAVTGAEYPGLEPVTDFDDDGFCDAQETGASPATDPYDRASRPASLTTECAREMGYAFPD